MFDTPILFIIFNRLEITQKTFGQIKVIQPSRLFIAADGGRKDKDGEQEKCEGVRSWVLSQVDWECEVKVLFQEENLGCKYAVSKAITWFFDNVEQGIILEDDCLPNKDFFIFCATLLDKYASNERIKHIGGNNFQRGIQRGNGDYYFSRFCHIWGWATWKRAWKDYDLELKTFQVEHATEVLKKIFSNKNVQKYWLKIFQQCYLGLVDTWDYQWTYCIWKNDGICILPQKNLVSNIGFGEDATHTKDKSSWLSELVSSPLEVRKYPNKIKVSTKADEYTCASIFAISLKGDSIFLKCRRKLSFYINHFRN